MFSSFHSQSKRRGSSYLEIQVAMVMLTIGMGGLYSMTVVQSKQAARLAQTLPSDEVAAINQASTVWERKLGVYGDISDTLVPADPVVPASIFVHQTSPDMVYHSAVGDGSWYNWTYSGAYLGTAEYHYSLGNVGSYCEYVANGIPPGNYEILLTYPSLSSLGDAIPCEVHDHSSLLATATINQKTDPSDETFSGADWDSLGTFNITGGTVRVRLLDGPGAMNYIVADAICIRPTRVLDVISVNESANGGATVIMETSP